MIKRLAHSPSAWLQVFDTWQQRHGWIGFPLAVIHKSNDDEAGPRATLLAYYAFLSIFPLLLVLGTIFRIILYNDANLRHRITHAAVSYFPAIGPELQVNVHAIGQPGVALILGVLLALFGARGFADTFRSTLDHIWQVPYARRRRFPESLYRSLVIMFVCGLCLAVTPVAFGLALNFAPSRTIGLLSTLLTAVVMFWLLIWVIQFGTSTQQSLQRIWLGAVLAVIGLGTLQGLGGYLMARELARLDTLYGTFALVLGLTFWLYLQMQVLLLALEVDSVRHFRLWPRSLQPPLIDADHRAYKLYHERGRFHDL